MEGVEERIEKVWVPLAAMLNTIRAQIIFTTATMPPYMVCSYRMLLARGDFNIIRDSSDRPNVAFHFIPGYPEPFPPRRDYYYEDIVHALIRIFTAIILGSSTPDDRILVFFARTSTVQTFAQAHNYLWHNSTRSKVGLDATLAAWDQGSSRVLVGTTSLAQGLDRPNVRIVIVANAIYGHTTLTQMLGRAGRDGLPADLLFVGPHGTDKKPPRSSPNPSIAAQHSLNAEKGCQRQFSMAAMDGPRLQAYSCLDSPAHPCGNCAPEGVQQAAVHAVREAQKIHTRQVEVSAQTSRSNVRTSTSTTSLSAKSARSTESSVSSISSFPLSSQRAQNAAVEKNAAQAPKTVSQIVLVYYLLQT